MYDGETEISATRILHDIIQSFRNVKNYDDLPGFLETALSVIGTLDNDVVSQSEKRKFHHDSQSIMAIMNADGVLRELLGHIATKDDVDCAMVLLNSLISSANMYNSRNTWVLNRNELDRRIQSLTDMVLDAANHIIPNSSESRFPSYPEPRVPSYPEPPNNNAETNENRRWEAEPQTNNNAETIEIRRPKAEPPSKDPDSLMDRVCDEYRYQIVDDYTCVVCMDNPITVRVQPCGHDAFCLTCAMKCYQLNNRCPICRGPMDSLDST